MLLEVHRGAELYDVKFTIRLRSLCQTDLGEPYKIEVHFAKPCSTIALAGQLSTGEIRYILTDDEEKTNGLVVYLSARRPVGSPLSTTPWTNLTHVISAGFQCRTQEGAQWTPKSPMQPLEIPDNNGAAISWDLALLPKESIVYVRAEIRCLVNGFDASLNPELFHSVSEAAVIRMDRIRPAVFHVTPSHSVFLDDSVIKIAFSESLQCGPPFPFTVIVTFSGKNAPDPLIASSIDQALYVRCVDNVVSLSLSYGFQENKLRKSDVAGRKATITLDKVRDVAGNLATSNVPDQELGVIQHTFEFEPINPFHTWFKVSRLLVRNITTTNINGADFLAEQVIDALRATPLRINAKRYRVTHVSVMQGSLNNVIVDLDIMPGGQMDEDIVMLFTDLAGGLDGYPKFQFLSGGGVDILFDDRSQHVGGSVTSQCDSSGVAIVDIKVDAIEAKVNGLEVKVDGIETKIDAIEAKINTLSSVLQQILIRLDNSSTNSGPESSTSQARDDQVNTQTAITTSNSAIILGVVALVGVFAVVGLLGMVVLHRRREQEQAQKKSVDQNRRTGDFSVSAYNPTFTSHPVFLEGDA